jgi:hypothetical protein
MPPSHPAPIRTAVLLALTVFLAACAPAIAPAPGAATGEEEAVLDAVQRLFDIMATNDTTAARRLLMPDGRFFAVEPRPDGDGTVRMMSHEAFIVALGEARERWLERMWEPEVRVHGPVAMVWTPYDFYRDGAFSHCGVDAVTLVRQEGEWRISGITYTVEREGCPPSPLGPP